MRPLLNHLRDRLDERRARRARTRLGHRRWLVSWRRTGRGAWLARLSCPEVPETVEQAGRTRSEAIAAAVAALTLIRRVSPP